MPTQLLFRFPRFVVALLVGFLPSFLASSAYAELPTVQENQAQAPASTAETALVAASDARSAAIEDELEQLHTRALELPLGAPITGVIAGYGGAAALLFSGASLALQTSEKQAVNLSLGFGIGAAAMLGAGIASHAWLRSRVEQRRMIRNRSMLLQLERLSLIGSPASRQEARERLVHVQEVQRQLGSARAEYGRYGLALPTTLMVTGLTLAVPLVVIGILMAAINDQPAALIAGVGFAGVGVGGSIWLRHRKRLRAPIAARIRNLEAEEKRLLPISFALQLRPSHASFSLGTRF